MVACYLLLGWGAAWLQVVVAFPALGIVTGMCQILSCLYACLGSCSIGQLELVIMRVLLKLADGACGRWLAS